MEVFPRMKRQWKSLVNSIEKKPKKGSMKIMLMSELLDICPIVEAWHKGKCLGEAYIGGGAQVCVITQYCVEQYGLVIAGSSGFKIRLANHQKVKCLGLVQDLELEVFGVKAAVNLHVMPAGLGAFPIILGRPWLRAVGAIQDWRRGVITLYNKKGKKKRFDMESKKQVEDEDEEQKMEIKSRR